MDRGEERSGGRWPAMTKVADRGGSLLIVTHDSPLGDPMRDLHRRADRAE
jgi:hypothetical protein